MLRTVSTDPSFATELLISLGFAPKPQPRMMIVREVFVEMGLTDVMLMRGQDPLLDVEVDVDVELEVEVEVKVEVMVEVIPH